MTSAFSDISMQINLKQSQQFFGIFYIAWR